MICPDKTQHALRALNVILTRARFMAHEANAAELARLLDAAEILPKYLAEDGDNTEEFRLALAGIAEKHAICSSVLDEFDQEPPPAW